MPSSRQIHMHFYNPPRWFKNVSEVFKRCPRNCSMSAGKGQDYYDKDVVIFFSQTLGAYPEKKRRGQIWVLYGKEPPPLHHRHIRKWKGLFNWTMTYRRDSDIQCRYGHFESKFNSLLRSPNITFKYRSVVDSAKSLKPKGHASSTAWFVSRCHAQSRREDYVAILNKTQSVDVFGRCGTIKCSKEDNSQCLSLLSRNYRFYLSFENSLCRDYITEKSFNFYTKTLDTVPITRGFGGIHSLYLPPGSFIDTSNYDHIDELGHFLNYLSKNDTLYSRYFQWRKYYQANLNIIDPFCELCDRMHLPDVNTRYHRVYNNIHQWFFGSSNVTMCTNAEDLRK
ncbi:alpha-(1,3)-fucosyltransferase C-like [Mizuhopecten yessoensis]|nr:alpha-(1,3)-fucosyltransferase C-like [Mizuhopecten yessoensis]